MLRSTTGGEEVLPDAIEVLKLVGTDQKAVPMKGNIV
jgi:hypothetical protein